MYIGIELTYKKWKQDCAHVDHDQLEPFKIIYTNIVCGLVVAQTLHNFKTAILVYMILKKGF